MFKKKSLLNEERGQVSFFMVWLFIITVFLIFFVFFIPWTIEFNSSLYRSAQYSFNRAQTDINAIQDVNVRTALTSSVSDAKSIITESTDNLSDYFQYAWILIPIIVTLIFFIQTRRSVEAGVI